jgi:uncharacterized protein YecA (UPF0149 family)
VRGFNTRDPVTGTSTFFTVEKIGRMYLELAQTHWVSFTEISRMVMATLYGPEALNDNFDLKKELRLLAEEGEHDAELLRNFDLPPEELFRVWRRSRRALRRLANFIPNRRETIKAMIAEQEDVMTAILERHERKPRKGNANGKE